MLKTASWLTRISALAVVLLSGEVAAQNFEIVEQELDSQRHGYTVIRVWGSHYEMGYAMGVAFAGDITQGRDEVKEQLGNLYGTARGIIGATTWLPEGIEDEIDGIVAGVLSVHPDDTLDALDVKVMNTFGDWGYYGGCRSHSCWGNRVDSPVETLSTRRLDFGTPFEMALHHVLCAWDPDDGSVRWVNMAWPGYVAVITGVNAKGTLVSLHDYGSDFQPTDGAVPRCVATRYVLTGMGELPIAEHLGWAEDELGNMTLTTGTFINYYAPAGHGGVFTCTSGGSCGAARTPQQQYMQGEVMMTTNSQTDGTTAPSGGAFMDDYYGEPGSKDLAGHFELMGTSGLHLMSVEYRGEEDMTIWAHGRGRADRIEVEWQELFPGTYPDGGHVDAGPDGSSDAGIVDAGPDGSSDAGIEDAGPDGSSDAGIEDAGGDTTQDASVEDAGADSGADAQPADGDATSDGDDDKGGGCGCASSPHSSDRLLLLLIGLFVVLRRSR